MQLAEGETLLPAGRLIATLCWDAKQHGHK
jgi:hypothetical protein